MTASAYPCLKIMQVQVITVRNRKEKYGISDTHPQMSDYFMSWPLVIAKGQEHK